MRLSQAPGPTGSMLSWSMMDHHLWQAVSSKTCLQAELATAGHAGAVTMGSCY